MTQLIHLMPPWDFHRARSCFHWLGVRRRQPYWFFHGHSRIVILWAHYLLAFNCLAYVFGSAKCLQPVLREALQYTHRSKTQRQGERIGSHHGTVP